ncbi:MAG: ATP-binding cassette domain-containing protein, partial [Chitinophagaceae bacterium]
MSVHVNHLYKSYGHLPAIQDISFSVSPGKILGFLGPNGAGKSTTLKIITGYLEPDQGEVTVCGLDVRTQSLEAKKKMGYLPESNPLYEDMYVREYLSFLADLHHLRNKKERIAQVIEQVG